MPIKIGERGGGGVVISLVKGDGVVFVLTRLTSHSAKLIYHWL